MADALTKLARQVRLPAGLPHQLVSNTFALPAGRHYKTKCGVTLTGQQGAMLTTRKVECSFCLGGRALARSVAEPNTDTGVADMVEAILAGVQ